jgi:uncharacterized protein DUF669
MTRRRFTKAWKDETRRLNNMVFFDPAKESDLSDFSPLAPGRYRLLVQDMDIKPTKKKDGRYVAVIFAEVNTKKKVWMNFNIENPSEKAQQIGRGQLKQFLASIGHTTKLESENDLYKITANKSCHAEVTVEQGIDGVNRNKIVKFEVSKEMPQTNKSTVAPVKSKKDIDELLDKTEIPF